MTSFERPPVEREELVAALDVVTLVEVDRGELAGELRVHGDVRRRLDGADDQPMELASWVEAVGRLRESPIAHRSAHLARLEGMPLAMRAVAIRSQGRVIATGLTIIEGDCAGLFDIITSDEARRQGHARSVISSLLCMAWELGARHAYLQVKEDNVAARRLYAQFGFEERYAYWYRGRPGQQE